MSAPSTKGAVSYQPGATPQEWNHPTKKRAESPFHGIAECEVAHHFRGVTKMVIHDTGRAFSPLNNVRSVYLGRCPRLVWNWALGPCIRLAPKARSHTSPGQRPGFCEPETA
jgi:hypothetical protein